MFGFGDAAAPALSTAIAALLPFIFMPVLMLSPMFIGTLICSCATYVGMFRNSRRTASFAAACRNGELSIAVDGSMVTPLPPGPIPTPGVAPAIACAASAAPRVAPPPGVLVDPKKVADGGTSDGVAPLASRNGVSPGAVAVGVGCTWLGDARGSGSPTACGWD